MAGIRAWIRFLGGQYNRVNDYSIPQQSINKGDFYMRGKQNIETMQNEIDRILERVGRRSRVLFTTSGTI